MKSFSKLIMLYLNYILFADLFIFISLKEYRSNAFFICIYMDV